MGPERAMAMAMEQTVDQDVHRTARRRRWSPTATLMVGAVVLLATGCSSTSTTPSAKSSTPPIGSTPTTPPTPALSATLVLPATTISSGGKLWGHVVVDNDSGRPIHTVGCGGIYQVLLTSRTYRPSPAWPACLERITIPPGRTSYKMQIEARQIGFSQSRPSAGFPPCTADGPPALSPGRYEATTFELGHAAPIPAPVPVLVIS